MTVLAHKNNADIITLFVLTLVHNFILNNYPFTTNSSEDPMGSILQGKYTDFTNEDSDYPSVVSIKKVGFMPSPRPTIASQSQSVARTRQAEKVS